MAKNDLKNGEGCDANDEIQEKVLQCMGSTFQAEGIAWAKSLR